MEPPGAANKDDKGEPGPECHREPEHEDQMPEVHRIACETVWALGDHPLWRDVHAGGAARTRQPIAADAQILQVSPEQQRHAPGYKNQSTLVNGKLESNHDQRAHDESL